MQATRVNIVVDVRQVLNRQSGDALVSVLGAMQGVSGASVSRRVPRLVLVDFDPKRTDTRTVLDTVVGRGFDARLVGM